MSNVDVTNGQASFISSAHLNAIEKLGTRLDNTFTAEEAMEQGNLGGWNVRKAPMLAVVGKKTLPVPGSNVIVRDNPITGQAEVLSRYGVSDSFTIIQNEAHADLLNALVDESGANFELAGATDGGRRVFISMKLPGHVNIGGVDPIENSLLALNSHDGSMAFTLMVTPVRYACGNVLNCAFGKRSHMIRIRHTSGAEKALRSQARQALDITFNYLDGFQQEAERMIDTTMTQAQFEEIINREFGAPEDAPAPVRTRADKKVDQMVELFADASTQDGVRETAWAGFNALTEWYDHFAPTRGTDREAARAEKALLTPAFKNRALELMRG